MYSFWNQYGDFLWGRKEVVMRKGHEGDFCGTASVLSSGKCVFILWKFIELYPYDFVYFSLWMSYFNEKRFFKKEAVDNSKNKTKPYKVYL